MTCKLDEGTINRIRQTLAERFGDPINVIDDDAQSIPSDGTTKRNMHNRGFGAGSEAHMCQGCGCMQSNMDESETCDECGMMATEMNEDELDQKAPPGRERQVKALKKNKNIDNPWAVAWSSWNKTRKK